MKKVFFSIMAISIFLSALSCSDKSPSRKESIVTENDDNIIITMATSGANYYDIDGNNMVDKFNALDNGYEIRLKNYMTDAENQSDNNHLSFDDNALCLDVMKGGVVDIVCDCFSDPGKFHSLAEKGAFVDLNKYMENDPDVNRDTLNDHILKLCEIDGKLPFLPFGYIINTLAGYSKYVGDKENWSFNDMIAHWEKMPENALIGGIGSSNTKDYVYLNILSMNMSSFIDFDKCEANYDSKEFLDILNFCNSFEYDEGFYKGSEETDAPIFLWGLHIMGFDDFHNDLLNSEIDPITFVGYPSDSSCGTQIEISGNIMGISALSSPEKQQGAWEFLKMFAEEKYQENMAVPAIEDAGIGISGEQVCFPINNSVFEKLGKERYDKENVSNIVTMGGKEVDVGYLSKSEYDRLVRLIDDTNRVNIHMEDDLNNIIIDEIWSMFAEEKSPEEVAKNIQNRAEMMVSEKN
jgi:ABC-type glycerol-3-phosphate transport system substrate-binding protein